MKLQTIIFENYKNIKFVKLEFTDFLTLIGKSNTGKSVLISGIYLLLNPTAFKSEYLFSPELPCRIAGIFIDDYGDEIKLSITKLPFLEEAVYRVDKNGESKVVTFSEFRKLTDLFEVIHIKSDTNSIIRDKSRFITELTSRINKAVKGKSFLPVQTIKKYNEMDECYVSDSISRNILLDLIREFTLFIEKEELCINNLFLFFEHPEMYLHPQGERELYDCLFRLSSYGIYIALETHSSRFVSLRKYHSICISKVDKGSCHFFQFHGKLFSGDEVKNFNMNYYINTDRSELFFAKKVILVEGQTDKILLSYLSKTLGVFKYEYSIIECGSKSLIPQFIKLLNCYHLNYVAVYDIDNHAWRSEEELENSNLKNRIIEHTVEKSLGCAIGFSNDIEEEIYNCPREKRNYRNKPFNALKTVSNDDFVIPKRLEEKIRKIFE